MANETGNFGLRAARQLDGSPYNGAQNRYRILKNYATAIYQGDLVMTSLNGTIQRAGATSNPVVGVFNGVFYTDPTTSKPTWKNYYPASISANDIMAQVIDGPDVVFEINADATFAQADLFQNYSVNNGGGNTKTGISEVQLDVSESGTNASFMVQAIDISQDPENSDVSSDATNVQVVIQNSIFGQKGAGLA